MLSRFALAAAQGLLRRGADHGVAAFAQSELDQLRFQPSHAIPARQVRRTNRRRELQVFADGQVLIERVFLRDVADVSLELVEVRIKRAAVQINLAAARLKLARQYAQQRALAATARAHHANQLAAGQG